MSMVNYTSPGPVAGAFLKDRSEVSAIMGPMGSGKTTSVLMKFINMAAEQRVSPRENPDHPGRAIRYTKIGVVRETTTNLKRTTIKSIKGWFGKKGRWFGGGSSSEPLTFEAKFELPDNTIVILSFEFIGLDNNNIEDMAKGWEITHYWLNEADLLMPDVKDYLDGRIGRYPGTIDGGASFYCGILDYNAPDTQNYLYEMFEEDKPEGHRLFIQPGGRSPHAENLHNLPLGYYERMIRSKKGKKKWWLRRNVDNIYGFSREGEPVYENYRDDFHCANHELEAVPGLPIVLYADAATHPAVIFTQATPEGQRRILHEVYIRGGAVQLADAVRADAARLFPGFTLRGGLVDPSADHMDEKDSDLTNWIDAFSKAMNFLGPHRFRAAPTNDPTKRQDAVDDLLSTLIEDGQPAILISPRVKVGRKGFNSTYCFKKRADGTFEDKPTKAHPVSDVHDAIQYFALDEGGYETVMCNEARKTRRWPAGKTFQAKVEVNV